MTLAVFAGTQNIDPTGSAARSMFVRSSGRAFCTRLAEHRRDRRAGSDPDCAQKLVSVPPIEGNVPRVAAFEIGRRTVAVEAGVCVLHQQRAEPAVLPAWINADQRQVPMRLGRMVAPHLIQSFEDELSLRLGNRALDQCTERF